MKSLVNILSISTMLILSACGGGESGSPQSGAAVENTNGSSLPGVNGWLTGKLYYGNSKYYDELNVATGTVRHIYNYYVGNNAMPNPGGQEFAHGSNDSESSYKMEDIVFFNLEGQETGRRAINGRVDDVVKISPDDKYVAFRWNVSQDAGGLIVLERHGSWERNFGSSSIAGYDWTSDGRLVFSREKDIFVVDNLVSGDPRKIASLSGYPFSIGVSPDNRKIAMLVTPDDVNRAHVFTMGLDGSDYHQVSTSNWFESSVAWSPDGQHLAIKKGMFLTNIPDYDYDSQVGSVPGNMRPWLYVVKSDAQNIDISADFPEGVVTVKLLLENGSTRSASPGSPIAWRDEN